MVVPRVCILRAPGTNCDIETAHAFALCGAEAERLHLFRLLESPQQLQEYQILCLPGGFSYGDDVGAGVVFGSKLRRRLAETIGEFLQADKLVLGICNGFQVLLRSGILPGGARDWNSGRSPVPTATLTWNDNGRYTARWVRLKNCSVQNVFLRGIDEIELPIAHAEGRLCVNSLSLLDEWHQRGQIALAYCRPGENRPYHPRNPIDPDPINPNGSVGNIAALGDPTGRILGMMPHPERFLFATQHPQWTRLRMTGAGAGRKLFQNAVDYFR